MEAYEEGRSTRKHRAILEAATTVFLNKGYRGTSMDEIAALASVSKQTVYKHFADKERLFSEIVLATTDQVEEVVHLVADTPSGTGDLSEDLGGLARQLLTTLMEPRLTQLRRLVIASADQFPELGRLWYERGFERVLTTLANRFQSLADEGHLRLDDPLMAAHHFTGLLLWIPTNRVMFCGDDARSTKAELHRYAEMTVRTFLAAYSPAFTTTGNG
jgi:TetR/AcrR family transcriptional regulator, mexJK operon transcriptional repressor